MDKKTKEFILAHELLHRTLAKRKCAFCGKIIPLSDFEKGKSKNGETTYRHKTCKFINVV